MNSVGKTTITALATLMACYVKYDGKAGMLVQKTDMSSEQLTNKHNEGLSQKDDIIGENSLLTADMEHKKRKLCL